MPNNESRDNAGVGAQMTSYSREDTGEERGEARRLLH
jgi:hypothetical protein